MSVPAYGGENRYGGAAVRGEAASGESCDDPWPDMCPVPEGFTLEEYPPLSEEQADELTRLFRAGAA